MKQSDSHEAQLHRVLHAYLQALDRGEQPDRQALLDAHPELRDARPRDFTDSEKKRHQVSGN